MNPIMEYFEKEIRNNLQDDEKISVFEKVVKHAQPIHVVEAMKCVACFPFGPTYVLEALDQFALPVDTVKEGLAVFESIMVQLRPEAHKHEEHLKGLERCYASLNKVNSIYHSEQFIYESTLSMFQKDLEDAEKRIVLEGASLNLVPEQVIETTLALTQKQFDVEFVKTFMNPNQEPTLESAMQLMRYAERSESAYDELAVLEGDKNGNGKLDNHEVVVKKNGEEVKDAPTKKAPNHVSRNRSTGKFKRKSKIKRVGGRLGSMVTGTLDKLDRMNNDERMEAIQQGGMRKKLSTLIRTAILTGAAGVFGPAAAAITLFTSLALRKKSDARLKHEMTAELKMELKMVREKIRDAESAGDRSKKYELMRIENHLERSIERIESPVRMNRPKLRKG